MVPSSAASIAVIPSIVSNPTPILASFVAMRTFSVDVSPPLSSITSRTTSLISSSLAIKPADRLSAHFRINARSRPASSSASSRNTFFFALTPFRNRSGGFSRLQICSRRTMGSPAASSFSSVARIPVASSRAAHTFFRQTRMPVFLIAAVMVLKHISLRKKSTWIMISSLAWPSSRPNALACTAAVPPPSFATSQSKLPGGRSTVVRSSVTLSSISSIVSSAASSFLVKGASITALGLATDSTPFPTAEASTAPPSSGLFRIGDSVKDIPAGVAARTTAS